MIKQIKINDTLLDKISGEWGTKPDKEGNANVIRSANFTNHGEINYENVVKRQILERKLTAKKLEAGDIIIEKSGGSPKQPVGRVVYFDLNEGTYLCNNFTSILRPNKNIVDPKYLLYVLLDNYKKGKTRKYQNKTTGIINLKLDKYLANKIPIPPLGMQKRIAKVLSDCEQLIRWRKESIQLLDDYLEATFSEMFGDPIFNKKEWDIKTIEQLIQKKKYSLKRGPFGGALKKEIFVEDGHLVYEQYHALNNDFTFERYYINDKKFEELKSFSVNPGDIIISCSGVNLGRLAIIPEGAKKGIINQALLKVSLDQDKMNNDFFLFLFRHPNFKKKFFGSSIGSGVPNFPKMSRFKAFKFIAPEIKLQRIFSTKVRKVEGLKTAIEQSLDEIENLYKSISQRAFKGELDLSKVVVKIVKDVEDAILGHETTGKDLPLNLKKGNKKRKGKVDISKLSLLDFLEVPLELYRDKIADDYGPELDFIDDDLFYQFYLKDNFNLQSFTFTELQSKFNSYYIPKGKDFDPVKWKSIIFKYLEAKKPLIEQSFEEESGTIKLKLTDEAFKA